MASTTLVITDQTEELPTRADGTPWPFAMTSQDTAYFADTRTELLAFIIDGYDSIPDEKAIVARYEKAVEFANLAQAAAAAHATEQGTLELESEPEEAITTMFEDRAHTVSLASDWDHAVPLVLIATDYEPYTASLAPKGNVMFINPHSDTTLLSSLASTGLIEFYENDEAELQDESNVVPLRG